MAYNAARLALRNGRPVQACLTYVGHATVWLDVGGVRVLTDPVLRDRLWHLRRHGCRQAPGNLPLDQLDMVLISHLHLDHADVPSLRRIPDHVPIIAPRGTDGYLRARLPHPVLGLRTGERVSIGDLEVIAVPANHRGIGPSIVPTSACAGFVVQGSATVYFAGDTALFPEMADLGRTFELDLALLPVGGFGPTLRGGHLDPRDAARALEMLRPRVAVPIHWGTLRPLGPGWQQMSFLSDPPYTFAGYAAHLAPETRVQVLEPGQAMALEMADEGLGTR